MSGQRKLIQRRNKTFKKEKKKLKLTIKKQWHFRKTQSQSNLRFTWTPALFLFFIHPLQDLGGAGHCWNYWGLAQTGERGIKEPQLMDLDQCHLPQKSLAIIHQSKEILDKQRQQSITDDRVDEMRKSSSFKVKQRHHEVMLCSQDPTIMLRSK